MQEQMLLSEIVHKVNWSPAKMSQTLRSPIKCPGGKFFLSGDHLTVCRSAMLRCSTWKEICVGGGNFTLQAEPTQEMGRINVVADTNPFIYNVWFCYADPELSQRLVTQLRMIRPINRQEMEREFNAAKYVIDSVKASWKNAGRVTFASDAVRIALATARIVTARMSRGGMGTDFAWQDRERGGKAGEINSWETFTENHSPRVARRCANVVPILADAEVLVTPDNPYGDGGCMNPDSFVYVDMPYVKATRTAKEVYGDDEWDNAKHERFIRIVQKAESPMAICGYETEMYKSVLTREKGWTLHKFAIVNHAGQNKKKQDRIECLWVNF